LNRSPIPKVENLDPKVLGRFIVKSVGVFGLTVLNLAPFPKLNLDYAVLKFTMSWRIVMLPSFILNIKINSLKLT